MSLGDLLMDLGLAGTIYFLVTMLLALIHDEPSARLRAWGLGLFLLVMVVASFFKPWPESPAQGPPEFRPPRRLPAVPSERAWALESGQVAPAGAHGDAGVLDPSQAPQAVGHPADVFGPALDHEGLEAVVVVEMNVDG